MKEARRQLPFFIVARAPDDILAEMFPRSFSCDPTVIR